MKLVEGKNKKDCGKSGVKFHYMPFVSVPCTYKLLQIGPERVSPVTA